MQSRRGRQRGRAGRPRGGGVLTGLLSWLALMVVAAALIGFFFGTSVLLNRLRGVWVPPRTDLSGLMPVPIAVAFTIGVPVLFDVCLRLAGRSRSARALPVRDAGQLARGPASFGTRAVPPGLQEVAFVPILLVIPVSMVGSGFDQSGSTLTALAGFLVSIAVLFAGLFGGPMLVVTGTVAWLPWAWFTLVSRDDTAAIVGLTSGSLLWVALYRYFVAAARRRSSAPARTRAAQRRTPGNRRRS